MVNAPKRPGCKISRFKNFLLIAINLLFLSFTSINGMDFTWSSGEKTVTYRYLPSTGTLNDLEVITSDGFTFRPSNYGGITSFLLGRQLLYSWEGKHQSQFLGAACDDSGFYIARFRWQFSGESFDFALKLKLEEKTLIIEAEVLSPFPHVITFSTDRSEATPDPRIIELPFGHPVLFSNGYFMSAILDPFYSESSWLTPLHQPISATSAAFGCVAWYFPRSDGRRNLLKERLRLTVSPWIEDTFFVPPKAQSSFREDLARRVVVDLWLDSFQEEEDFLRWLASFGFKDLLVLIHRWQKYGYDNGLPSTYPAGEIYGGHEGLKRIGQLCRQLGYRLALHTNYVDFYPNSDVWNPADVALDSQGKLILSWFNSALRIQSYLLKPTKAVFYARLYEPLIHEGYETSAAFLDVHTAILPSFKVDFDARIEGSGRQLATFRAYSELFQALREIHQGPICGEGYGYAAHIWAGQIDSFEADPRSLHSLDRGIRGYALPCLVDYKLKVLHHRFVPYGAGLMERFFYFPKPSQAEDFHFYRATEIAFGHAGYIQLSRGFELIPEEVLREYCFLRHLQQKYLQASVKEIYYEIDGEFLSLSDSLRRLLPLSLGPESEDFLLNKLTRLKIVYDQNLTIYVNRSMFNPWDILVDDKIYTLPPGGFLAKEGNTFLAYTALVNGIKEYFIWPADSACRGTLQNLILAPLEARGEKRENRSLFMKEYINVITWKPNPANEDIKGYRLYREENGARKLVGEVNEATFIFLDREVLKDKEYAYYIVAFNSYGREGQAARIEIK